MTHDHPGTALVTGASSGIGAIYAERLAARGYDLILVARSEDRLTKLATRIEATSEVSVLAVKADLTDKTDLRKIETLIAGRKDLTLLVNNAGLGSSVRLLDSDPDQMEDMIALNVRALTGLTHAVLPGFVSRNRGTIINIASIVGIAPELLNGVYGGTKAFVIALSQSLASELRDTKVKVQVVLPGATATDFWTKAGTPLEALPSAIVMSAEDMVDAALAGLDLGEDVTIPSLPQREDWDDYQAARRKMMPHLSLSVPASRYRI